MARESGGCKYAPTKLKVGGGAQTEKIRLVILLFTEHGGVSSGNTGSIESTENEGENGSTSETSGTATISLNKMSALVISALLYKTIT